MVTESLHHLNIFFAAGAFAVHLQHVRCNNVCLFNLTQINAGVASHYSLAAGEAFEVTGPAGTSLEGWSIQLYNGDGGTVREYVVYCNVRRSADDLANDMRVHLRFGGVEKSQRSALHAPDPPVITGNHTPQWMAGN